MKSLTTREAKRRYPNEWVVMEVVRQSRSGEVLEGRVVTHTRDRDEAYRALMGPSRHLFIFYAGRIPKPGYVLGF